MSAWTAGTAQDLRDGQELDGLGMDHEEIARKLLIARRPEGRMPDREVRQTAAGGAYGGGFAALGPKTGAGEIADLEQFEGESLESKAESGPAEAANAGEGLVILPGAGHGNRGVARRMRRKFAAGVSGRLEAGRLTRRDVVVNAQFVAHLVQRGVMTEAQAVELIVVPDQTEAKLRAFAAENPIDTPLIIGALKFRRRVLVEFERLLTAAACSPSPGADRAPEGGFCAAAGASARHPGLGGDLSGELLQTPAK